MKLRPLRMRDAWFCWKLSNDPSVREVSTDQRMPTLLGHLKWMRKWTSRHPDVRAMVVLDGGVRAGLVRGERDRGLLYRDSLGVLVGIAICKGHRGRGLGVLAIREGTDLLMNALGCEGAFAKIRPRNTASIKAFREAGYVYMELQRSRPRMLVFVKETSLMETAR